MPDVHDDGGGRGPAAGPSDLDFDVDALAADLQAAGPDGDDGEFEELEELVEVPDEPTHPRRLFLVVDGRVHPVVTQRFVIGRVSSQCDLAIIDANVSRQHCAIERRDGLFYVMDLGSTNGVVVDGVRVDDHPIEAGDVLVLSGHRIECTFEPPVLEPMPAEAPTLAAIARAVTGRMAAVPEQRAPAQPVAVQPAPATFEARVEARLESIASELAALVTTMQRLVERVEGLEGVEALAQVIHRRLELGKPPVPQKG